MQFSKRSKSLKFSPAWAFGAAPAAAVLAALPIPEHPWIFELAFFLSWPGYNGWLVLSILFLVLPFTRLFPSFQGELSKRLWPVVDVLIFAFLFSQAAKHILKWPRPSGGPSGAVSGHSVCAFGLAWLLSNFYPRYTPYWFSMAISVAWSRAYTQEHYAYQVVLGVVIGTITGYIGTHCPGGVWCPRLFRMPKGQRVEETVGLAAEPVTSESPA